MAMDVEPARLVGVDRCPSGAGRPVPVPPPPRAATVARHRHRRPPRRGAGCVVGSSGGVGTPDEPDSVESSGPLQSGSARSLTPSPSSSIEVRALGEDVDVGEVAAVRDVDLDAALADADDAAATGAGRRRDDDQAEDRQSERQ